MRIIVHAKPGSKREKVGVVDSETLVVSVKALPIKGRANDAIIKTIARHYDVPKSSVRIVSGKTSPRKVVEIQK